MNCILYERQAFFAHSHKKQMIKDRQFLLIEDCKGNMALSQK